MSDAGCCEHWEEVAGPEMEARIAELERREALYATVAIQARRYLTATQRGDNIADMSRRDLVTALNAVEQADDLRFEEALGEAGYLKWGFTYDPDAPLKLA